jgi:hypothetical protein
MCTAGVKKQKVNNPSFSSAWQAALILLARWPCFIRKCISSQFPFFVANLLSLSQNDINLHPETCEMTTIHLQTLLIKAELEFFFVALLDFCHIVPPF